MAAKKQTKVEAIETTAGKTKALETKKDTTKAIETRAAVLKDPDPDVTEVQTAKKTAKSAAKRTVSRTAGTKNALKCEMFLQFAGKEFSEKELLKLVKEVWTKEMKRKVGELKDVKLYLKPEESAVYYVINKETTGRIDL